MMIKHVSIAFIALVGLAGNGVSAQETRSVKVSYADLDVASRAGMKTLEGRVSGAADNVCGRRSLPTLADKIDYNKCRKAAINNAMDSFQAKNPTVYASR